MKQLKLSGNKTLTREQLKKVTGGRDNSNSFFCNNQCITDVDCPVNFICILTDFGGGELCWRCGQLN
ncbi:hypothetical protein [Chitinophaga nivalis]|uniref:Bacteriocin n=1 Tax=Chitinophaga nivalis TaxID=2991709 RepID=A0ABT3IEF3_9BACT|nr:hypothetical protein [Chitinophaga nivalis]MCW3468038.1 hypothetical protein [Chitinophaga nivalis]MCW3482271.1 hypothetical protein [Chitinophaga nivalis]